MNRMNYKGYHAKIEFDPEDHILVGRIIGIRDVVVFHGESVNELETAFREAVDDYLAACAELGQDPNKPYSGNLMLRIPPEIHAAVATAAETGGKNINQWAAGVLEKASHGSGVNP
jgi:predicted HicB family RNase H-like nuclease